MQSEKMQQKRFTNMGKGKEIPKSATPNLLCDKIENKSDKNDEKK